MRTFILFGLLLTASLATAIRPQPAAPQTQAQTLTHATIHTGTGEVLTSAMLVYADGVIQYVGPQDDTRIMGDVLDLQGAHIYPGFILSNTNLGLTEVDSVSASVDYKETGTLNPNVRSAIAYNADSMRIPAMRFNGILLAQVTPTGGLVSGSSSVMQLDAWNWDDALIKEDDGLHVNWPGQWQNKFDFATFSMKLEQDKDYLDKVNEIKSLFNDAKATTDDRNLKLKATAAVFDGSKKLFIHAKTPRAIMESIHYFQSIGIDKPVLITDGAAIPVIDFIRQAKVPVIVSSVHDLPQLNDSPIEAPYQLAVKLSQAGILTAITYPDSMSSRNLPFTAGTTVAHGLDKETALQLITLNPAKILGIDKQYGSLVAGKSATFFISQGDALDMASQNIRQAVIDGRNIDLQGKQQKLYDRFQQKYQLGE